MITIDKYCSYIQLITNHINAVSGDYIASNLVGRVDYGWVTYRDPDKNWYSKTYVPELNKMATSLIGMNSCNKWYYVKDSDLYDVYLNELFSNLEIRFKDEAYAKDTDEPALIKTIDSWKTQIRKEYDRSLHIKAIVWELLRTEFNTNVRRAIYDLARKALSLPENFDFDQFEDDGKQYTVVNYLNKWVRLDAVVGIFCNFRRYGYHFPVSPKDKEIVIKKEVYHPFLFEMRLVQIGPDIFDNNSKVEDLTLPDSLHHIEWSFWKCKKLKNIHISTSSPCQNPNYKSIDGVLFSGDGKTLIAYPNAHGNSYSIPDGVTSIEKFAFKSCDVIETLYIPQSMKRIGINAFYRCANLSHIVCDMNEQLFAFEGFIGDYMPFNASWFFKKNIK